MTGSKELLNDFQLRFTPSRQAILNLFLKKDFALSHGDIERAVPSHFDRVTVYRTLKTFLDKGLIHKVLDDEGGVKYALCSTACTTAGHHHDHVHFKCTVCGQTNCLNINIPSVKLPRGYRASELNLLIQGVCENCA
ncbi:transcriptional repressor [Oscillatoria amoena NRMC-F 0135]|nr:transcriptional repressor [Oscillatoria amoena NRMC-F 0135]